MEHVGLGRGRGRGRGRARGQVKKTLNIVKAVPMPQLYGLSLDKDFEALFNNNNLEVPIERNRDDNNDDELQNRRRKFVQSGLFRKSINSITADGKRREDNLNRVGSRSNSCLFVNDTRNSAKNNNIGRKAFPSNNNDNNDRQFNDADMDVQEIKIKTEEEIKIETEEISPIIIEDTLPSSSPVSQYNKKKPHKSKEREWDRGKIYDTRSEMWMTEDDNNFLWDNSNTLKTKGRDWDKGKSYDAESGRWMTPDYNTRKESFWENRPYHSDL